MDLKLRVRKTIEEHSLIEKGDRVVLGFSGGPDSLCLLFILNQLQSVFDFRLSALHVNHKIRGKAAEEDAAFAREFCEKLGVPFTLVEADVPKLSRELGKTEEEAGRDVRAEALKKCGADKIALAHNRDDQAETVLMRIIRGTGVHGLCAMEYKRADGIIRPLLDAQKSEILKYCEANGLSPRIDATNSETEYTRNKIRLELLPYLKENYNPNMVEALIRLSENASKDDAALSRIADGIQTNSVKELAALDEAVFSRVVQRMFKDAGLCEDISAVHINALRSAVLKNYGGKVIEFPHGYIAEIKKGKVLIKHS